MRRCSGLRTAAAAAAGWPSQSMHRRASMRTEGNPRYPRSWLRTARPSRGMASTASPAAMSRAATNPRRQVGHSLPTFKAICAQIKHQGERWKKLFKSASLPRRNILF